MNEYLMKSALEATERGWFPDAVVRFGIRRLCAERLGTQKEHERRLGPKAKRRLVHSMSSGAVALATAEANQQHYEEPTGLFLHVLGPHLKYSCCYWPEGVRTLGEAEERSLAETCSHAQLADGMDVLELGCGWGSLTLWMASRYPDSRITAVSNSNTQRAYIESAARERALNNVSVVTADMNSFDPGARFDRVVSVEMFEHMHNYRELLKRVSRWMWNDGRLFIHVFAHKSYAYKYETDGAANWMAQNFFTGGVMPSRDLLGNFQQDVRLVDQWWWLGEHYQRTAEAWLDNMKTNREALIDVLASAYGRENARIWYHRWRTFFLACAELWGYRDGQEWGVGHYLFEPWRSAEVPVPSWALAS